jgi:hypothetical protein
MGARDDGQPQRVRDSPAVRLAVGGETIHRLDQGFDLQRRPNLRPEVHDLVGLVGEVVVRPGLDHDCLARASMDRAGAELHRQRAGHDLERPRLLRMEMPGRKVAAGATYASKRVYSPPVSIAVSWKTSRSPVTGS